MQGHPMTVVEADGHYVKPFVVDSLSIYSGETYSVLIKADQDPNRNYWLASNVVSRKPGTATGTAVLSYYGGRSSLQPPPPSADHPSHGAGLERHHVPVPAERGDRGAPGARRAPAAARRPHHPPAQHAE